jgi:hypothetical protein
MVKDFLVIVYSDIPLVLLSNVFFSILNGIKIMILVLYLGEFSKEQLEFLDKFFKDNPWADNAQIESIVKQTGLNELIIKVKISFFLILKIIFVYSDLY